jgi:ureidoglycolate hydrolase
MRVNNTAYKVFATKGLQFVNLSRTSVHEAFVTAAKLRSLGWCVTVSR